jgi:hypothetical protein
MTLCFVRRGGFSAPETCGAKSETCIAKPKTCAAKPASTPKDLLPVQRYDHVSFSGSHILRLEPALLHGRLFI